MKYVVILLVWCLGQRVLAQDSYKTLVEPVVTTSGISIQGNLKTSSGENIIDAVLSIDFEVRTYATKTIFEKLFAISAQNVSLDSFGNFSTVMPLVDEQYVLLQQNANKSLHLALMYGGKELLLLPLHPVPYAAVAFDGVPIGSIVPFLGTSIPPGYLPCDGRSIPVTDKYKALREVVGANVPNLTGVFLRGAGTNEQDAYKNAKGPDRRDFKEDMFESHIHGIDVSDFERNDDGSTYTVRDADGGQAKYTQVPKNRGKHLVQFRMRNGEVDEYSDQSSNKKVEDAKGLLMETYRSVLNSGTTIASHAHELKGDLGYTGAGVNDGEPNDTRPINVGVNYMIKF